MDSLKKIGIVAGLALLATGCERQEVSSYEVPKERYGSLVSAASTGPGMGGDPHGGAQRSLPHVHAEAPQGWEERQPEGMRVAVYLIKGEGEKFATVAVIPFVGAGDMEAQTVNLWREELKLDPMPTNAVSGLEVEVGEGLKGEMFEIVGKEPIREEKWVRRTLGAMFRRQDALWFVKMTGESELVASQREAFKGFLKTMSFHDAPHGDSPQVASAEHDHQHHEGDGHDHSKPAPVAGGKDWKMPAGWVQESPGQMILAQYNVRGKAKVTVTSFPGDVGGLIPNMNRWRGQVDLETEDEAGIRKDLKDIELASGAPATVADMTGPKGRIVGVIVKRGQATWFYKMLGDPDVVGAEKDKLIEFAATAF